MELSTPIEYVKGIGPERAKLIRETLGIHNVEDLLTFYPIRYLDKSKIYKIGELGDISNELPLKGKITNLQEVVYGRGKKRLMANFTDGTGNMELVWFKYSKWLKEQIPIHTEVVIFGKVQLFNRSFSMAHPEIEKLESKMNVQTLFPVYSSSEKLTKRGINNRLFQKTMLEIFQHIPHLISENLSQTLLDKFKLLPRAEAFQNIHFPKNNRLLEAANRRIKFEEAFFFQLGYGLKKKHHKAHSVGNPFPIIGEHFNNFYHHILPFELTKAQKRVLKEIRNDLRQPIQMNRLLQGDVGSGKTMVALLTMLIALDNGFQSCMMAPTEILAQQHFNTLVELLAPTDIKIKLLTGSTKTAERREIHQALEEGSLSIIVGTHALLENKVQFKNLGLAIIDEQHRFGVAQRAKLWGKNTIPPHILVMTATPIPRTLAMSFYSDLDVSVIDELPGGRKPIITVHRRDKDRAFLIQFIKEEIAKGRQIYFVYPLIEESETLDYKNLNEGFDRIKNLFPVPDYNVVMLHGKMKPEEKDVAMQYFASGGAQIMVATTVIEVGVNVPNASVMIIESADRFGLAQLHQLRGRVGRGAEQSYCILMTSDKLSAAARKRIKTMVNTNDGFKISEVDMEIRGPGDIMGTQQSGIIDFKKLDILYDAAIIKAAKQAVEDLLEKDSALTHPENLSIRNYYIKQYKGKNKWAKIS